LDVTAKENRDDNGAPGSSAGPRGQLGVSVEPLRPEVANELNLGRNAKGVVVTDVDPSGPAAEAGIQRDDVIVSVNQTPVASGADIRSALQKSSGDRPALLVINRGGREVFVAVRPSSGK
jgi:S1-C subfamily serine protease